MDSPAPQSDVRKGSAFPAGNIKYLGYAPKGGAASELIKSDPEGQSPPHIDGEPGPTHTVGGTEFTLPTAQLTV